MKLLEGRAPQAADELRSNRVTQRVDEECKTQSLDVAGDRNTNLSDCDRDEPGNRDSVSAQNVQAGFATGNAEALRTLRASANCITWVLSKDHQISDHHQRCFPPQ